MYTEMMKEEQALKELAKKMLEEESRPGIPNPSQTEQLTEAYALACRLFQGTNVRVTGGLHKPMQSMGFVTLEAQTIPFANASQFARLVDLADNWEIYPMTNGNIRLTLTFHRLTVAQ